MKLIPIMGAISFLSALSGVSYAKGVTPCVHWPMTMASVSLKNEGYLTQSEMGEPKVTTELLAFQKIKPDLYREVFYMQFTKDNGQIVKVITASDLTSEECSGGYLKVYLVDKTVGRDAPYNTNILDKKSK